MEKIYMEENKSQKQKQQQDQKRLFNISIVLSFVVAAFAIVSLLTVAFDKPSYAAPDTETVPDDITFYEKQNGDVPVGAMGLDSNGNGTFVAPLYYRDQSYTLPLFCVEHKANVGNEIAYSKNSAIEDYGLLYILNNSFAKSGVNITDGNKYMEAWATQVAIWLYLDRTTTGAEHDTKHALTDAEKTAIENTKGVQLGADESTRSVDTNLYTKIDDLVEAARTASSKRMLTVEKAAGETTTTSDKAYFQSTLITVAGYPPLSFKSYDITISGVEGAKAVTENGEDLALTNNLSTSIQKLKTLIPDINKKMANNYSAIINIPKKDYKVESNENYLNSVLTHLYQKEKENEKNVPKLDEPNNENEVNKPIEGKIPEKTFSKNIENVEIKLNNEPLQQSTGADMDDNLDHLPTINSIMKGNAEPLPPSKKKKY